MAVFNKQNLDELFSNKCLNIPIYISYSRKKNLSSNSRYNTFLSTNDVDVSPVEAVHEIISDVVRVENDIFCHNMPLRIKNENFPVIFDNVPYNVADAIYDMRSYSKSPSKEKNLARDFSRDALKYVYYTKNIEILKTSDLLELNKITESLVESANKLYEHILKRYDEPSIAINKMEVILSLNQNFSSDLDSHINQQMAKLKDNTLLNEVLKKIDGNIYPELVPVGHEIFFNAASNYLDKRERSLKTNLGIEPSDKSKKIGLEEFALDFEIALFFGEKTTYGDLYKHDIDTNKLTYPGEYSHDFKIYLKTDIQANYTDFKNLDKIVNFFDDYITLKTFGQKAIAEMKGRPFQEQFLKSANKEHFKDSFNELQEAFRDRLGFEMAKDIIKHVDQEISKHLGKGK